MNKRKNIKIRVLACVMVLLFAILAAAGIVFCRDYSEKQLMKANQEDAMDVSMLIAKNISITDEEVQYLKSLTFNEMERDPINRRLTDMVDGMVLNNDIINLYVLAPLKEDEVKYTANEENADFFKTNPGTKLNGIWLLNSKFDKKGKFQVATREDIYRYVAFCSDDLKIFEKEKSFAFISEDSWGKFITGYTPIYSSEGSYIGVLGVDMDINHYNEKVTEQTNTLVAVFLGIILILGIMFWVFFTKYIRNKESMLYYDFYSRVSHDMRTPMNGILGIAQLSEDENDPVILKENIRKMKDSGQYLLGLINDTLDVEKIQSGNITMNKEIVDSREIVCDIKNMIEATAQEKGVHFTVKVLTTDTDDFILADRMRLKQIFVNILSNAIKFTPEGGSVEWLIDVPSRNGAISHNEFTIRDTGIGMSEDFVKNDMFKPFAQEYNSMTTQYAGSGLGLSIVKNLVELMGGSIQVESVKGEGTTFKICLDFEKVDRTKAESRIKKETTKQDHSLDQLKGKHILLAEDHPLNAEIASKLLEKYGCIVTWTDNGEKTVNAFHESEIDTFDAILMDIRMPVMDGLEAASHIRKLKRKDASTIPIIAMTANAYDEDVKKSTEAGMNAHLAKPVDPKLLYQTLMEQIKISK